MDNPAPPNPHDADPDPAALDIPDGLTFGVSPGAWRLATAGNRQLLYLVVRTPSTVCGLPMDKANARKLAEGLLAVADSLVEASALMIPTFVPPDPSTLRLP